MNLYSRPGFRTNKALIAAAYVGAEVLVDADKTANKVSGRVPVLETTEGCIFSSNAINRFIARIRRDVGLYGDNLFEDGMIDSWVEFCTNELEIPLCTWTYSAQGIWEDVADVTAQAKLDVKRVLEILDKHLRENTYFVGHRITLADICVCCMLAEGFQYVFDDDFRKPHVNLIRWFNLCIAQPEFQRVLGKVVMCSAPAQPSTAEQPSQKEQHSKENKEQQEEPVTEKNKEERQAKWKPTQHEKRGREKREQPPKGEGKKKGGRQEASKEEEIPLDKTPEELEREWKAKLKKVVKEGGKRGVEIEGAADMGGLQFFCTSVDEPDGDMEMMMECMNAMNAKSDPKDEERKGGSGHIGKMIFSAGRHNLLS